MLRLRDTATGEVRELSLRDPGKVGLYVCGPTVYGSPHIGHGRFALVYDVLWRYLEFAGLEVNLVSNVTDVDDKIIERAALEGHSWHEVAAVAEQEWWNAMERMGVRRPTTVPHATEYIDQMIGLVSDLLARQRAYATDYGVYFDAASVSDYGLLKHQPLDTLRAGARIDVDEKKRAPIDFALWKAAKPGEPSWEAPFGPGRPGWHTECVAMSLSLLGEGFDLHGGGEDLIFPHHENERAQAVADGKRFATHWMHNGLVRVHGEKMSKSLGNTTPLAEMLERHDPRAYRLLILQSDYRQPIEVHAENLGDAATALRRIDALARKFADAPQSAEVNEAGRASFRRSMDDDLDTARAVGDLFVSLRRANSLDDEGDLKGAGALARSVLELFTVLGIEASTESQAPDADVAELVSRRDAARASGDFAASDRFREEIQRRGFVVEDTPAGTRVYRT